MARTRLDDWLDIVGDVLDGASLLACGIIGTFVYWVTALYSVDALWPGPLPEAAQWLVLAAPFVALLVWASWPRSDEAPQDYEPHRFFEADAVRDLGVRHLPGRLGRPGPRSNAQHRSFSSSS